MYPKIYTFKGSSTPETYNSLDTIQNHIRADFVSIRRYGSYNNPGYPEKMWKQEKEHRYKSIILEYSDTGVKEIPFTDLFKIKDYNEEGKIITKI